MKITQEDSEAVKKAALKNIVDKVAGGGIPTDRELKMLDQAAEEQEPEPEAELKRSAGRPSTLMRWTIEMAAREFGVDRKTMTKRLASASMESGADGRFSTVQVAKALFGGTLDEARKEQALEQAALTRVKREIEERKRPPLDVVLLLLDEVAQSTAATLKAKRGKAPLTQATINEIFEQLRDLPERLKW